MSEIFSMGLVLVLYYLLFVYNSKRKWLFSGIVSGLLIFIRYSNILIMIPFVGFELLRNFQKEKKIKPFLLYLSTFLPFLFSLFIINFNLYGGILRSGYSFSGESLYFDFEIAVKQLFWYCLIFTIIYPGMLLLPMFSKIKEKFAILISFLLFFLLYIGFPGYNFNNFFLNLIVGFRFFIPILGLLMLLYFDVINNLLKQKSFILLLFVPLITISITINYLLSERRDEYKRLSDEIYLNSETGDFVEGSQILINEAFRKGIRYIEPEPWIPLNERENPIVNE